MRAVAPGNVAHSHFVRDTFSVVRGKIGFLIEHWQRICLLTERIVRRREAAAVRLTPILRPSFLPTHLPLPLPALAALSSSSTAHLLRPLPTRRPQIAGRRRLCRRYSPDSPRLRVGISSELSRVGAEAQLLALERSMAVFYARGFLLTSPSRGMMVPRRTTST